jgi:hypothetical protein
MAPAAAEKLPLLQEVQASPVVAWNWPAAQSVHTVAGLTAKRPLSQISQETAL